MSSVEHRRLRSDRFILKIKCAYWAALLIIAAVAFGTHLFLKEMSASYHRDSDLSMAAGGQRTLSQRILFLANAARVAEPDKKRNLIDALGQATAEFEQTYSRLSLHLESSVEDESLRQDVHTILYAAPFHLEFFSISLVENSKRFIAARQVGWEEGAEPARYQGDAEWAELDEAVASATLAGYESLLRLFEDRASSTMGRILNTQAWFLFAIIVVICLLVAFIFRPMTELIRRRTGELVDAHNSMAFIAIHDGLTGLYNRSYLAGKFAALLATAGQRQERLAVVQFDLDRFKKINDTLGHAVGDAVLVATAQRMRTAIRPTDICVRLGGDEFVVVMPSPGTNAELEILTQSILRVINEPIVYQGATILCGASAGVAIFPTDGGTGDELLNHADIALYASKKAGGGRFNIFSDELRADLEHRKRLESDLAAAIANDELQVHFQPQVWLMDGTVAGVEALVRWQHPQRGIVPPSMFIPLAEQIGLMPAIGMIIMTKAIREAASWHREGIEFGRLAVNVSGAELAEPGFTKFLFDVMQKEGLPPHRLSLEIVESVILDDEKTGIAATLRTIRAAGVHLELDDFGTGYASLTHVNPKEIDRLKIDRRFVRDISRNTDHALIVRAICDLARGLGISVVAEGAETREELSMLLEIGCNQVQGYFIAYPAPGPKVRDWLLACPQAVAGVDRLSA
jgi:diguanylate cyclase (GGDEF)-like protein